MKIANQQANGTGNVTLPAGNTYNEATGYNGQTARAHASRAEGQKFEKQTSQSNESTVDVFLLPSLGLHIIRIGQ